LVDEARVVAVLRSTSYIHELCNIHQMPFRFELLIGDLYVAIFSRHSISAPEQPIEISGWGIVAYLVNLYESGVIAPFVGHGELLITCERMGRICIAGDQDPELISQVIGRWQNWTGRRLQKTVAVISMCAVIPFRF